MRASAAEAVGEGPHVPSFALTPQRGSRPSATAASSVCLPARECAATVGPIVEALVGLRERGAIDEVLVVDAASADGTAEVAARRARACARRPSCSRSSAPVLGKGDAMWRALSVLDGEIVCFLDADTAGFAAHFATGLLGPLVCERGVEFVKAFYRRPFVQGGARIPREAGASTICWRARRLRCSTPSSPACASRWRARSRRAASCSRACRSRPATAWRSGC